MTIREITNQLYDLSVGGYFNGDKFTKRELQNYITSMSRPGVSLKAGNRLVMEIALPDGRWLFTIDRYSDRADGFDYYIPDDRVAESRVRALLS